MTPEEYEAKVNALIRVGATVASTEQFHDQYTAQAIVMLIAANGGEMLEGPLYFMSSEMSSIADFVISLGGSGEDVLRVMARTMVDVFPIPEAVYAEMVENYEAIEDLPDDEDDEHAILARLEKEFED